MSKMQATRYAKLGIEQHGNGTTTINGAPIAPPKMTSDQPLPERLAAIEARLRKGGDWLDAEQQWLNEHVGAAGWDERDEEVDRQLERFVRMLEEGKALALEIERQRLPSAPLRLSQSGQQL